MMPILKNKFTYYNITQEMIIIPPLMALAAY